MTVNRLIAGYRTFHQKYFVEDTELFQQLKQGQSPKTLVITCSDSRVSPVTLTGASPGEMFVVRNVANLVPPYQPNPDSLHGVSAALEFAVCHLQVEHIIVMGHSGCGGIKALREGIGAPEGQDFSFIAPWVRIAENAKCDSQHECEKAAIKVSMQNLESFPWIAERISQGSLAIHGWYFRLDDGKLLALDGDEFGEV